MEQLNGVIYNFFGTVLPDFGFPDKRMWSLLSEMYPNENWDRGQVYDLYKWYQTGIEAGQRPFSYDTSNTQIFEWMKANSPYTYTKVTHWQNVFITGVKDNWIEGRYIGTQLAPASEARILAEGTRSISRFPSLIGSGIDKLTLLGFLGMGILAIYYGGPLLAKTFKKRKLA